MQVLKANTGITVLFRHIPSKLVSIRYVVKCGSLDEHVAKEYGLCHALEHMFFAGTTNQDWEEIQAQFRNFGAYSNASTTSAFTEYEILVPTEYAKSAFPIMADFMYNSTFPVDRWNKVEKPAIINEILAFENDPDGVLEDLSFTHALGGAKKYHSPVGSIKNIKRAKVSDLLKFRDRFYQGENIFLSIAGGLTADEALALVDQADQWKPGSPEPRKLKKLGFNYDASTWTKPGCGQPLIQFLRPIRKVVSPEDTAAHEIVTELLNNYLMTEVREKRGLCYGISAHPVMDMPHADYLSIVTSVADAKARDNTIDAVEQALSELVEQGLSDSYIQQARMDTYRNLLVLENSGPAISMAMVMDWMLGKTVDPIDSMHLHVKTLPNEKIREVAAEMVTGDYKVTTLEEPEDYEECVED